MPLWLFCFLAALAVISALGVILQSNPVHCLLGLAVNLPELDGDERALVVLSMITSAYVMEGADGGLARSIEARHGTALNREARKELKNIRDELDQARTAGIDQQEEPSIYEVVCDAFEAHDEDEPFVRQEPKLGRNDPCWCGSGKKYKKCHLDADASPQTGRPAH